QQQWRGRRIFWNLRLRTKFAVRAGKILRRHYLRANVQRYQRVVCGAIRSQNQRSFGWKKRRWQMRDDMTKSEQLERDAERIRAHLGETATELRARLTPTHIVDQLFRPPLRFGRTRDSSQLARQNSRKPTRSGNCRCRDGLANVFPRTRSTPPRG